MTEAKIEERLVLDIKGYDYFTDRNFSNDHGGGEVFAYDDEILTTQ